MEKQFKISVVVPIYNTGRYLEQLMQCIVMQTIGFAENIQVIFVNDGSTDDSGIMCRRLSESYPHNIKYIDFGQNRGVSIARNTGMDCADGKYITFMDSDDLWSLNAFEEAVGFLEGNASEIDLVSADIEAFEAYSQPHILNQDLNMAKLIDMNTEYSRLRVIGSCCIMKTEAAKRHRFHERQKCWEDTVFVNQVMLEKQKYGMLPSEIIYYYRRRRENNSASQSYGKNKQYYLQDLELVFHGLYDESIEKCGTFIPMMQYLMAYALAYRFAEKIEILSAPEEEQYFNDIYHMLQYVEDRYLAEVCNADEFTKKEMLAFKRGLDLRQAAAERKELSAQNHSLRQRLAANSANYRVLKKWFELKAQGKEITSYFSYNRFHKIAIYGMSDLGKYLVSELGHSEVEAVYGIDRRADVIEADIPVMRIGENLPEADVIVVTAVYYYDEIQSELSRKVNIPIISIEDIMKVME